MKRVLHTLFLALIISFTLFTCINKERKPLEAFSEPQSPALLTAKDLDSLTITERINDQLVLTNNTLLTDAKRNVTLFNYEAYNGEVTIERPNKSTLVLTGKAYFLNNKGDAKLYSPVVLVVNFTKDSYTTYRDKEKETFPKLTQKEMADLVEKFNTLKNDTAIIKSKELFKNHKSEEEEASDAEIDFWQQLEDKITQYDQDLVVGIMNGCIPCKDIFYKKWPELLGDNLNGMVGEQHNWNAELIEEYYRKLP